MLILEGNFFRIRGGGAFLKARELYRKALSIDSSDATVWAALAEYYYIAASRLPERRSFIDSGIVAANRSISLNPNLALAHITKGKILRSFTYDFPGAKAEFEIASNLEPENAALFRAKAQLEMCLGGYTIAIGLSRKALESDPLSDTWSILGFALASDNQMDEAVTSMRKAIEIFPERPGYHTNLGLIYFQQGKLQDALQEASLSGRAGRLELLALICYAQGAYKAGDSYLDSLAKEFDPLSAFQIAEVSAYVNKKDEAFHWLEKSYTTRDGGLSGIMRSWRLKTLWDDPRWEPFLKKMMNKTKD